jgi:hypothetical protein
LQSDGKVGGVGTSRRGRIGNSALIQVASAESPHAGAELPAGVVVVLAAKPPHRGTFERKEKPNETTCCCRCRLRPQPDGDDRIASHAGGAARSGRLGRYDSRRRRLRSGLASRPLWQTLLPQLIRLANESCQVITSGNPIGSGSRPRSPPRVMADDHFPRKPSSSSSYFAGASRNTRCPAFGMTSACASGINAANDFASAAFCPIFPRSASGAFALPGAL